MDLENQDSEKPERRSKWSLVIVVSGRTHEMNCLDSCKAELETVAEKKKNKQTNKQTNKWKHRKLQLQLGEPPKDGKGLHQLVKIKIW